MSNYISVEGPADYAVNGEIALPGSKSMSNRAIIIQALSATDTTIEHLSEAEDTLILQSLIRNKSLRKNAGMAGTAYRFMTAFLATQNTDYLLTGAERMLERPIAPLVEALKQIGADIEYLDKEGYPPLKINGKNTVGGDVEIDASVSSQFISALMMIAPMLDKKTTIKLLGKVSSSPYISLTQSLMESCGAKVNWERDTITIEAHPYQESTIEIEGDWSSAAFYYSCLALADEGTISLSTLYATSLQGDQVVADIFYRLGIVTVQHENHLELTKSDNCIDYLIYDFTDCPDLAQAIMATCAGLGVAGSFSGLSTLRIKETDRILAMQNELAKIGWQLNEVEEGSFELSRGERKSNEGVLQFNTYNDHRMAMAFAPLSLIFSKMEIENPEVVNKSNPRYWEHLNQLGLKVK